MRTATLGLISCPNAGCWSPLRVAGPPYPDAVEVEDDLLEGVLRCTGCRAEFPVLAGVAVLEVDLTTYLAAFWDDIEDSAESCGARVTDRMRRWLGVAEAFVGLAGPRKEHAALEWATAPYLQAHFDPASFGDDLPDGWWKEAVEGFRTAAADPYALLLDQAAGRAEQLSPGLAVEVGCGPGRGTEALAACFGSSVGVDRSFRSILAGRRHLLSSPGPLLEYRVEDERRQSSSRPMHPEPPRPDLDLVVGSASALPFRPASIRCLAAMNLLCAVNDPAAVLAEFARASAPGSLLLLATPFWADEHPAGSASELADPAALRRALDASFDIDWERDGAPWIVRLARRRWNLYLSYCVAATRRSRVAGEPAE